LGLGSPEARCDSISRSVEVRRILNRGKEFVRNLADIGPFVGPVVVLGLDRGNVLPSKGFSDAAYVTNG
jgi:hypothetical protein